MNAPLIALLVAVDVVVTVSVVMYVVKKRGGFTAAVISGKVDLAQLRAFTESAHETIGEYLQANYSGHPEMLPGILSSLIDQLGAKAVAENLPLDREALKMVLLRSITMHRAASTREVQAALKQVA